MGRSRGSGDFSPVDQVNLIGRDGGGRLKGRQWGGLEDWMDGCVLQSRESSQVVRRSLQRSVTAIRAWTALWKRVGGVS